MKKIFQNKISVLVLILFIFCVFSAAIYLKINREKEVKLQNESNNKKGFTYNDDGSVTLGPGLVANGFYDTITNKIIDSGSLFKPVNGKIQGQVSFKQNMSDKINYLLIILVDYKQHDFIVNNTTYSTFPFSLEGEEELRINVEITDIKADAHEFSYFIITDPDITELSIDNSNEWDKLLSTINLYWWRLLLSNSTKNINQQEYDNNYIKMDPTMNFTIQLTKSHQEVTAMPTCKSTENVELILGNKNDYDMEYVLLAFLDWKQVAINDDNLTKYVKIPPNTNIYYKLKIPYVEENTPYQIFAIPKPFTNDIKSVIPPSSTLRTIILPEL